jgi:hypothetical protein
MKLGTPPIPETSRRKGAGVGRYIKEAFLFRWNLLLFLGGTAAAILSPWPDILLPLVGAAELTYLGGLISIPKFRSAIDVKAHQETEGARAPTTRRAASSPSVTELIMSLPRQARERFQKLHHRCLEMRSLAHGVRGRTGSGGGTGDDIRTPALDRLLWVFLRLLVSQSALNRFLETTDEPEIIRQLEELRAGLEKAKADPAKADERITRSLQDSVAVAELRLDNYRRAEKNAEFVSVELGRIEGKIQVLTEMSVSRQDPDFLSRQVDSVAESMKHTEKAINELQHITGLTDELEEPPAILESNLKEVLSSEG